jgi:hypothetical protein
VALTTLHPRKKRTKKRNGTARPSLPLTQTLTTTLVLSEQSGQSNLSLIRSNYISSLRYLSKVSWLKKLPLRKRKPRKKPKKPKVHMKRKQLKRSKVTKVTMSKMAMLKVMTSRSKERSK